MKTGLKAIFLMISYIISMILGLFMIFGILWYTLPELSCTSIGQWLLNNIHPTGIFWITLSSSIFYIILFILQRVFGKYLGTKIKNLFIHLNTWLMGLGGITLALITFILVNPLVANEVIIQAPRKIGIGVCLVLIILFHICSTKFMKIINRKIQAYETAKEVGSAGKSSIILINFLKLFELFFPEMIMLILICFCVSWNIASYFIVALTCCVIPVLGNIECDHNIRKQAQFMKKKRDEQLSAMVAKKMKEQ